MLLSTYSFLILILTGVPRNGYWCYPHFTMKGISKEIFEKLCPVLALWRPPQVLSFSPHTSFSVSSSKTTKDRVSQKASLQTALISKSHDQAQQLCHITIRHIALLDGQRPQNFNLLQHGESWLSPFAAEQESQVNSELEKAPKTIYLKCDYISPNNRQNFLSQLVCQLSWLSVLWITLDSKFISRPCDMLIPVTTAKIL